MQHKNGFMHWNHGMNMPKSRHTAFTLLESLIALLVTSLILLTIQFSLPLLKTQVSFPLDVSFQTVIRQIETQKYTMITSDSHSVRLNNSEGKKMNLTVHKSKLQLSADGSGQIILLRDLKEFNVIDCQSYLKLEIVSEKEQKASGIMYLHRVAKHE